MKKTTRSFIQYVAMMILFLGMGNGAWAAYYATGNAFGGWGNWSEMKKESDTRYTLEVTGSGTEFKVFPDASYGNSNFWDKVKAGDNVSKSGGGNASLTKQSGKTAILCFDPTGGDGAGWLWVEYKEGGGSTAGSVKEPYIISVYNDGLGYNEKFEFTPVAGSTNYEYEVTFTVSGYTGSPSDYGFWVGENNDWKDGQSKNDNIGNHVTDCETGTFYAKIYALTESGQAHGSANNYYIHNFVCSEAPAKLTLTSSVREFNTSNPPASVKLTAEADDKTEGNYIWYFSGDQGETYTKLGETESNVLELNDGKYPSERRWDFKVARKLVGQNIYKEATCVIYTIQSCASGTDGSNIFHEDFGTLTAESGLGSRGDKETYENIVPDYDYQEVPYKVNDGSFAVVANPYYCGCGEGGDNDNKVDDACLKRLAWFRDLPDHTLYNTTETGPYGGMLMINFKEPGIAYARELNSEETANISKNSILTFSAYFASAARERSGVDFQHINVKMIIQFQKEGTTEWKDVKFIESQVQEFEDWQRGEVEWTVEDDKGKFRVVINNLGSGSSSGNDLLVDDIRLDLCTPSFTMHFYDEVANVQSESVQAPTVTDEQVIRVKQIDFGSLGKNVCLQAYQVIENGSTTTYSYITDMVLDANGYYVGKVDASMFTTVPDNVKITCVASALDHGACNEEVKNKVLSGEYQPDLQTQAVFSSNTLEYTIACGTTTLKNPSDETSVCVIVDADGKNTASIPALQLTSNNVGEAASVAIFVNDTPFVEGITYKNDAGMDYMTLDLNQLYAAANGGAVYSWTIGTNTIKVQVTETYAGKEICQRWANGSVAIEVKTCGDVKLNVRMDGDKTSFCAGEEFICFVGISGDSDLPATIWDIAVMVEWDEEYIELTREQICREFNPETGKWSVGVVTASSSASIGLKFKTLKASESVVIRAYISTINGKNFGSYEAQTKEEWASSVEVEIKDRAESPQKLKPNDVYSYNLCPVEGTVYYNSLLTAPADKKYLVWLDADSIPAINDAFDSNVPQDSTLYVYNNYTEGGLCVSDTLQVRYRVKQQTPTPVVRDSVLCGLDADAELIQLKDLVDVEKSLEGLEGYSSYKYLIFTDEDGNEVTTADPTKVGTSTYQVTASLDEIKSADNNNCEAYAEVTVTVKDSISSVTLTPEVSKIIVGADDTKTLEVEGSNYTVTWYVNGEQVAAPTTRPYVDTEYKVVVTGECNSKEATSSTTVEWPTVFTPYKVDGLNDNFVQDMEPNLPTAIYNRFGAPVVETQNGWDGRLSDGRMAMPGVYYYVVTLPDGNYKKGTIEIYKK